MYTFDGIAVAIDGVRDGMKFLISTIKMENKLDSTIKEIKFQNDKLPYNDGKNKIIYIVLVILIFVATLFSFRKTLKDQTANPAMNMKTTLYFMLAIITYSSFTIASAVGIYWVTSNIFTIVQNILVERKKVI